MIIVAAAVLLCACTDDSPSRESRQERRKAREAKAEETLARGPQTRSYSVGAHQLVVIEAPVKDSTGFVDVQRCFVWRDADFRQSTLSCGQQPDVLLSN